MRITTRTITSAAIELLLPVRDKLPAESVERREAVQVLGLCYYLTGRFADAIPLLEETRALGGGQPGAGLHPRAWPTFRFASPMPRATRWRARSSVEPESAAAHLLAAQMMIRLEMEPMAEAELKRALEKDPRIPRAHYLLGQMALFRGRLDEAIALSEKELAINPADAMALFQIGDAHVRASRVGRRDRGAAEVACG